MSKSENQSHMNYSAVEPVLFEKLHNIKFSQSVFRVTMFYQFESTKPVLDILLHYAHNFDKKLENTTLKISH